MARFEGTLKIERTGKFNAGRPIVRLLAPFKYVTDGAVILVPEGFETDYASIPRFFWRIFLPNGRYAEAAVLHDYLYGNHSKTVADAYFYEAMTILGVPWWKRVLIYYAVVVFGRGAYQSKGLV